MSNLELLLEELLFEGRFEDAQKKYPDASDELAHLKAAGVDSKFAQWFAKKWSELDIGVKREETMDSIAQAFKFYNDLLKKKLVPEPKNRDINSFPDWETWISFVGHMEEKMRRRKEEDTRADDKEVIYKDNQFLIIQPNSSEASCKFGKGTRWCISAKENNMFDSYASKGADFYFIIDRKTDDKDALATYPSGDNNMVEVFNSADEQFDFPYLLNKYPENLHDILYSLAYGEEQAKNLKQFMDDPVGRLMQLEPTEAAVSSFYHENLETFGEDAIIQVAAKILAEMETEELPTQLAEFVHQVGWNFDSDETSVQALWKLYGASRKFLNAQSEYLDWNGPIALAAFAGLARRANVNSIGALLQFVKEANFLSAAFIGTQNEGAASSAVGYILRRPRSPELVFQLAQADPKAFSDFIVHAYDFWPTWGNGIAYSRWVGDYLAGKHGIEPKTAASFVGHLPTLWEVYTESVEEGNADNFKKFLPTMLSIANKYPIGTKEETIKHMDLFMQLILETQGKRNALIGGNLLKQYNEAHVRAARLLRDDMKRFFPELIR